MDNGSGREITLEELYELKEQIDEGEPRERVFAAIGRKQGDQLDTLADRHGVVEKTIRNWHDRFEKEPIEHHPYDAPRPGGPAKIEGQDRDQLFEQLQQPPTELGYDQQAWSTKLLLYHVKEEYGVEYHENYAYELLREAGLSLRTARPQITKLTPRRKSNFSRQWKKRSELNEKTVVVVDQFTKHVGTVQRRGWYPIGSNPTIETATSRESAAASTAGRRGT
ncbi:IS630 family transposase [Natrarchaeobius sp. A-rgal3]|uniref:IS630 family transposase n=1 Tax=Natrarchaeobius versutus TaxID=1679078 RepID=UPI00350FE240